MECAQNKETLDLLHKECDESKQDINFTTNKSDRFEQNCEQLECDINTEGNVRCDTNLDGDSRQSDTDPEANVQCYTNTNEDAICDTNSEINIQNDTNSDGDSRQCDSNQENSLQCDTDLESIVQSVASPNQNNIQRGTDLDEKNVQGDRDLDGNNLQSDPDEINQSSNHNRHYPINSQSNMQGDFISVHNGRYNINSAQTGQCATNPEGNEQQEVNPGFYVQQYTGTNLHCDTNSVGNDLQNVCSPEDSEQGVNTVPLPPYREIILAPNTQDPPPSYEESIQTRIVPTIQTENRSQTPVRAKKGRWTICYWFVGLLLFLCIIVVVMVSLLSKAD